MKLLAGAAGALAGLGIYIPGLWWISLVGVGLFAYTLNKGRTKDIFLIGAVFGVAQCASALVSFWTVLPLSWIGLSVLPGSALIAFVWCLVSVTMGVFIGLFAMVFTYIRRSDWSDALLFAALWTMTQYVQMLGFAVLTYAPTSLFGAHFSNIMLGYSLAWFSPLLELAYFGGVYATTFAAALFGYCAYLIAKRSTAAAIALIAVILIATAVDTSNRLIIAHHKDSPVLRIAAVHTSFDVGNPAQDERKRRSDEIATAIEQYAADHTPDILLLPETSDLFALGRQPQTIRHDAFKNAPVAMIDSRAVRRDDGQRSVRMFFYDASSTLLGTYDKMFYVPQGEYTPFSVMPAISLIGGRSVVESVEKYRTFARGERTFVYPLHGVAVGALFCSEVVSPALYRSLAMQGAQILFNESSESFFHGSWIMVNHMLAAAKTRAVENGRYLVTAGNDVPSEVVSDRGEVVADLDGDGVSVLTADVPLLTYTTPYAKLGDMVLFVPLIIVLLLLRHTIFSKKMRSWVMMERLKDSV